MAGLLDTQEIPNLKELFRDEAIGIAALHLDGEKVVIHSEIYGDRGRRKLALVQEVNVMIDEKLKAKGIEKLTTYATTEEEYRYNVFLGYKPTGNALAEEVGGEIVYEFEKVL